VNKDKTCVNCGKTWKVERFIGFDLCYCCRSDIFPTICDLEDKGLIDFKTMTTKGEPTK
jgi:hypothetical protein